MNIKILISSLFLASCVGQSGNLRDISSTEYLKKAYSYNGDRQFNHPSQWVNCGEYSIIGAVYMRGVTTSIYELDMIAKANRFHGVGSHWGAIPGKNWQPSAMIHAIKKLGFSGKRGRLNDSIFAGDIINWNDIFNHYKIFIKYENGKAYVLDLNKPKDEQVESYSVQTFKHSNIMLIG